MKNWKTWTRGVGLGFVVVGLVLGGCADDDDSSGGTDMGTEMDTGLGDTSISGDTADTGSVDDIETDMGGMPETTSIRAIHLSPDAPGVDIFVNKTAPAAVSNLTFPNGTGFLQIPAGTYTFDIAPTGTTVGDSVLTVADLALAAGKSYTAVALNALAEIQALALEDDLSTPGDGLIRIRAIHAATGVGEVDIWNIPAEGAPAPLFTDVAFAENTAYADVPAGAYTIGIDVDNDATPDLVFDIPALAAGTIANVFAVSDNTGVFLLAQFADGSTAKIMPTDMGGTPETTSIRAIHLSPDAPGVDIFVNKTAPAAVSNLTFPNGTGFLQIPAGTYTFDIAPTGTTVGDSVLTVADLALAAGKSYTAVALNAVAEIQALALEDDLSTPGDGLIRIRAIHAAAGVGEVDIWNIPAEGAPAPLFTDVAFAENTAYADVPAGAYTVGIDVDNDATPDLVFDIPALAAGTIANVFAVSDNTGVFLLAQFADGTTAKITPNM